MLRTFIKDGIKRKCHASSSQGLSHRTTIQSVLYMWALGAFLKNQEGKAKSNECGGILAFVSCKKDEEEEKQAEEEPAQGEVKLTNFMDQISESDKNASDEVKSMKNLPRCLQFTLKNAHFLQRIPYY